MESHEKQQLLLTQLILMFQTAALQQMGKLKSPVTDKIERDLPQAQVSIDILDMLHGKMKGNLSEEEDKLFTMVLQELKLNYVDELSKDKSSAGQPAPSTASSESSAGS